MKTILRATLALAVGVAVVSLAPDRADAVPLSAVTNLGTTRRVSSATAVPTRTATSPRWSSPADPLVDRVLRIRRPDVVDPPGAPALGEVGHGRVVEAVHRERQRRRLSRQGHEEKTVVPLVDRHRHLVVGPVPELTRATGFRPERPGPRPLDAVDAERPEEVVGLRHEGRGEERAPVFSRVAAQGEAQLLDEADPALADVVVDPVPAVGAERPGHPQDAPVVRGQQLEPVLVGPAVAPRDRVGRVVDLEPRPLGQLGHRLRRRAAEDELDLGFEALGLPPEPPPDELGLPQVGPDLLHRPRQRHFDQRLVAHGHHSDWTRASRRSTASMNSSTISSTTRRVGLTVFMAPTTWPTK